MASALSLRFNTFINNASADVLDSEREHEIISMYMNIIIYKTYAMSIYIIIKCILIGVKDIYLVQQ